jgi:hypothetical protein
MKQRKAKLRGVRTTDLNATPSMFPDLPSWPTPAREPKSSSTIVVLQSLQRPAAPIVHDEPPSIAAETSIEIMHRLNWATRDLASRKRRDELNNPHSKEQLNDSR